MLPLTKHNIFHTYNKRVIAWLLAVFISGFFSFWNVGKESFHPEDESLHVSVVQQMIFNDHILIPYSEKGPYFNKPPLKMWMTVPLVKIFGSSPFVYRFWDALFGFCTILMTFYLGTFFFKSYRIGLIAELFLCSATVFLFDHCIRSATQDSAVVLITILVLYWGVRYIEQIKIDRSLLALICLSTAFGLFIKSVGALQGIFMIIFVAILLRQSLKKILFLLLVVLVSAVPVGTYFTWISFFHSHALSHALNTEILNRVVRGLQRRYEYFFYLDLIFNRHMAISGFALLVALGTIMLRLGSFDIREKNRIFILTVFALMPILVFSFVSTRLEWYIVPALPAQALLCAYALVTVGDEIFRRAFLNFKSGFLLPRGYYFPATKTILSCLAFAVMSYGFIDHLYSGTNRILFPIARSPITPIEIKLARNEDIKGIIIPSALTAEVPSRFERAHIKSLGRGTIYQTKSAEEFLQKTSSEDRMLALGQPDEVLSLFQNGVVTSYVSLPPVIQCPKQHQRRHWLTLISTSQKVPEGFIPVLQRYTLQPNNAYFPINDDVYSRELGIDVFIEAQNLFADRTISLTIKRQKDSVGLNLPCETKQNKAFCFVSPEIMKQAKASFGVIQMMQSESTECELKVEVKIHSKKSE